VDDAKPSRIIPLDPKKNRTYHYWHVFVPDLRRAKFTGTGQSDPTSLPGVSSTIPKSCSSTPMRAVAVPDHYRRMAAGQPGDNSATAMKSVAADVRAYDWEGDGPLIGLSRKR